MMADETMTIAELQAARRRMQTISSRVTRVVFSVDDTMQMTFGFYGPMVKYREEHFGHVFANNMDELIAKGEAFLRALPDDDAEWKSWFTEPAAAQASN